MSIFLAFLAGLTDLLAGLIPLKRRFKHDITRYVIAFASGTVISAAFFELLPEANVEANWYMVGIGFFIMYLVDKGLALHQCGEAECEISGMSWVTVLGMASDNIIDGAGIAVTYLASPVLGIIVTIAVIAHEIPQSVTTTLVMKEHGYPLNQIILTLALAGVMYPIGALLGGLIPEALNKLAIGFIAGVFIYTGVAALMTEAHRRFNRAVMFFLLVGGLITFGLKFLE